MQGLDHSRTARAGFTLVETIVVLAVVGILAVSLVAGMDVHASVVVEADVLRSYLGYVQSLAMANNTATWGVSFSADSYTLLRDGSPAPIFWPDAATATYALPAGMTIISGTGEVTLDEYGAPAATHVVTFSDGEQQQQVSITGFTGLVP